MKFTKSLIAAASALVLTLGQSHGALTLTVNTADSTFAFSGSETGTPQFFFSDGRIAWSISNISPGFMEPNGSFFYQNDVAFSTNVGTPGGLFHDTQFTANSTNGGTVIIELEVSETGSQTLTGNNVFQSYSGLGASGALLALLDGSTLSAIDGHGFGGLNVQVINVPEPSSMLLLSLGCFGVVLRRSRR